MPERRKLLINHYKTLGASYPISFDNLPDPRTLDPLFRWWTHENYPFSLGETDPYNVNVKQYHYMMDDDDPDKIRIPVWNKGGWTPPFLDFLDVSDYITRLEDNEQDIIEKTREFYDKLVESNAKLGRDFTWIKNRYTQRVSVEHDLPLKARIESFINRAMENKTDLDKEVAKPSFNKFKKIIKKKDKNDDVDDVIKNTKSLYDEALKLNDRFVHKEGSAEAHTPIPIKEDASKLNKPNIKQEPPTRNKPNWDWNEKFKTFVYNKKDNSPESYYVYTKKNEWLYPPDIVSPQSYFFDPDTEKWEKTGFGKKRISKKEILKHLKTKSTKSKPNIKGLDTAIFKILNS
jgi:hypothetical protein